MQNHSNTAVLTAELPADAAENEKLIEQAYEAFYRLSVYFEPAYLRPVGHRKSELIAAGIAVL